MPAVGGSRRAGSHRRTISEINMVPFIDVMLVLLIIFMVSAPLIATGVVDLPSVGASRQQPEHVIEVVLTAEGALQLKLDGQEEPGAAPPPAGAGEAARAAAAEVALRTLVGRVHAVQGGDATTPVVISADRSVRYESVVRVMDGLQRAGVQRVGLSVKAAGG